MTCAQAHRPNQLSSLVETLKVETSKLRCRQLTVFCDLDGPIIDVSDRYYRTYCLALSHTQAAYASKGLALDLHSLSKEQFWQLKQERTADHEIALRSGLQLEQIDYFLDQVNQIVNQPALLHQDLLQPGVRWSLALLHALGAKLAVVTLRQQAEAEQVLQAHGLAPFFTTIRGTGDSLAAYQNYADHKKNLLSDVLAETADHRYRQAWMIGDTEADVLAGQAVGIATIALTCGIRSYSYLSQLAPTRIHQDLLSATHFLLGIGH